MEVAHLRSVVIWSSVISPARAEPARSPVGRVFAVLITNPPYPLIRTLDPGGLPIIYPGRVFLLPLGAYLANAQ